MGVEKTIIGLLSKRPEGVSISDISSVTGHTRATAAKYLELMKLQNKVDLREVGKAKLWVLTKKTKKVLVAEDEDNIRKLIKIILGRDQYDIIEARDGEEALEKVSEEMPDLIVLDLMMPKVDGIEVCKQLKKNALTKKIPIIMLTAKKEMKDKVIGITVGAEDYLTKPFEPRELRIRVKTFLDQGNRERDPITNLPIVDDFLKKSKGLDERLEAYSVSFKNLDIYKENYGLSKTNELIRLTSQIITHILEKLSEKNFVGYGRGDNVLIAVERDRAKDISKEILNEFESTVPFFYDADYENIDFKKSLILKADRKGKMGKVPLVQLDIKKLEINPDKGD